mmetsp:Transcript_10711/g.32735  ORF Transcript_10711/g.32735 Transcript_10711/m.32735 type:complete len:294 (+) Transcript_10711:1041-1922(+)
MRLEESLPCHQLDYDAPEAPDVAREGPAQPEHDLGRPVVPRGHDLGVMLVLKRRGAKVNEIQVRLLRNALPSPRALGGLHLVVLVARQQNVLGLQVRVHQPDGVQKRDRLEQLPREGLHVVQVKGPVVILPQQVEEAQAELGEHDADMAPVVEPLLELHAVGAPLEISLLLPHRVEHGELQHPRAPILGHVPYHLDRDVLLPEPIPALDDLAEGPLAEVRQNLIPLGEVLTQYVLVVAPVVVRPVRWRGLALQEAVGRVRRRRGLRGRLPEPRGLRPGLSSRVKTPQAGPPAA